MKVEDGDSSSSSSRAHQIYYKQPAAPPDDYDKHGFPIKYYGIRDIPLKITNPAAMPTISSGSYLPGGGAAAPGGGLLGSGGGLLSRDETEEDAGVVVGGEQQRNSGSFASAKERERALEGAAASAALKSATAEKAVKKERGVAYYTGEAARFKQPFPILLHPKVRMGVTRWRLSPVPSCPTPPAFTPGVPSENPPGNPRAPLRESARLTNALWGVYRVSYIASDLTPDNPVPSPLLPDGLPHPLPPLEVFIPVPVFNSKSARRILEKREKEEKAKRHLGDLAAKLKLPNATAAGGGGGGGGSGVGGLLKGILAKSAAIPMNVAASATPVGSTPGVPTLLSNPHQNNSYLFHPHHHHLQQQQQGMGGGGGLLGSANPHGLGLNRLLPAGGSLLPPLQNQQFGVFSGALQGGVGSGGMASLLPSLGTLQQQQQQQQQLGGIMGGGGGSMMAAGGQQSQLIFGGGLGLQTPGGVVPPPPVGSTPFVQQAPLIRNGILVRRTRRCNFFNSLIGCKNGDACPYIHDPTFVADQKEFERISASRGQPR